MTVLPQLERELIDAHTRRRAGRRRLRRRVWPASRLLSAAVPATAALIAAAVVAVFAGLGGGSRRGGTGPAVPNQIALAASAVNPRLPLSDAIDRALPVLRRRLHAVFPHARVLRFANSVIIDGVPRARRAEAMALTVPGQLRFFDWEADVLTPTGKTVAAQLPAHNSRALEISQGGASGPGAPGAGSLSLYAAVKLASRQPAAPRGASRAGVGASYYLFGAPGSPACTTAAADQGTTAAPLQHCLLAGPAASAGALTTQLPAGVTRQQGQELVVPPGTVVLQAMAADLPAAAPALPGPNAQFYVLRGRPLLTGAQITHPQAVTDAAGGPDVQFGFSRAGAAAFQRGTAVVARRGAKLSTAGNTLAQHFAIALDDRLMSLPQIDFRQYPDGIIASGRSGADITGGFTAAAARTLALLLRYGPLRVDLVAR